MLVHSILESSVHSDCGDLRGDFTVILGISCVLADDRRGNGLFALFNQRGYVGVGGGPEATDGINPGDLVFSGDANDG